MHFITAVTSFLSVAAAITIGKRAVTPGTLSQVISFGTAPTDATFFIYVPTKLAASPGVVVALHYCTGTAQEYYDGTAYKTLSEKYGFIVIYPSAKNPNNCWDVSSKATLSHEGGGDSNTIANMVKWTITEYKVDRSKVFVSGLSSGAMMANVMAATYPDLFKGAAVYSGVGAGCFASDTGAVAFWNESCAKGHVIATPEVWADIARDMYPGYAGPRPKMQVYHGSADTALVPQTYKETMKQWAAVLGYDYNKPQSVTPNDPLRGYTRTIYGPNLQGIFAEGVGHTVPLLEWKDMEFFGFA